MIPFRLNNVRLKQDYRIIFACLCPVGFIVKSRIYPNLPKYAQISCWRILRSRDGVGFLTLLLGVVCDHTGGFGGVVAQRGSGIILKSAWHCSCTLGTEY